MFWPFQRMDQLTVWLTIIVNYDFCPLNSLVFLSNYTRLCVIASTFEIYSFYRGPVSHLFIYLQCLYYQRMNEMTFHNICFIFRVIHVTKRMNAFSGDVYIDKRTLEVMSLYQKTGMLSYCISNKHKNNEKEKTCDKSIWFHWKITNC